MAGIRRGETGSAQVRVDCPAGVAWDLISDVTRIPEWSPECFRVRWQGSSTEAKLGAKFRGWNRNRAALWATTCRIDQLSPPHRLAFTVVTAGEYTRWAWTVDANGEDQCTITQSWTMLRELPLPAVAFERLLMGVADRRASLQQNIERGLEGVKAALESRTD